MDVDCALMAEGPSSKVRIHAEEMDGAEESDDDDGDDDDGQEDEHRMGWEETDARRYSRGRFLTLQNRIDHTYTAPGVLRHPPLALLPQ